MRVRRDDGNASCCFRDLSDSRRRGRKVLGIMAVQLGLCVYFPSCASMKSPYNGSPTDQSTPRKLFQRQPQALMDNAARLRRAFKYPDDDDATEPGEGIDEEGQRIHRFLPTRVELNLVARTGKGHTKYLHAR